MGVLPLRVLRILGPMAIMPFVYRPTQFFVPQISINGQFFRTARARLPFNRLKGRVDFVRIMASDTAAIILLAPPMSGSLSMHTCTPVIQLAAVALDTQFPRLVETYEGAIGQVQAIAIVGVVTIETPAISMVEIFPVLMVFFEYAYRIVRGLPLVAITTGPVLFVHFRLFQQNCRLVWRKDITGIIARGIWILRRADREKTQDPEKCSAEHDPRAQLARRRTIASRLFFCFFH